MSGPINGMRQAASAMRYLERRQEVVANNLANVDTHGFKGERVFARMLGDGMGPVADTMTDRRGGSLKQTGSPLDIAIAGNGFLVVDTPQGERLTRGGSFRLDESGQVVDPRGNVLLGEGGPLTIEGGTIEIDTAGKIIVDGKEVATLRVEDVPAGTELIHEEGTLFAADGASTPVDPDARKIRQGHLEDSNVSSIDALVDMISIQRAYSAAQKTMVTLDDIRGTIANELGKPV
jgi:flagellar basal-body rod protein FlgF